MLSQCEKVEFDNVVKSYLKAVYRVKTLVVTDGKDDGGLDIKVLPKIRNYHPIHD